MTRRTPTRTPRRRITTDINIKERQEDIQGKRERAATRVSTYDYHLNYLREAAPIFREVMQDILPNLFQKKSRVHTKDGLKYRVLELDTHTLTHMINSIVTRKFQERSFPIKLTDVSAALRDNQWERKPSGFHKAVA